MSPKPAGQVSEANEHSYTSGKSISTLAANGIYLHDDDDEDDDEHPVLRSKSLSYYANEGHTVSGKCLPTAEIPPVTRYGDNDNDLPDAAIVEFLAQNPDRLAAVLDEEPAILENFLAAEPIALSNYLQSNPSVLRNFFEAKPECLWAYFASCPEKLGQFCNAHPKFMSEWLIGRQSTVQKYLNKNPALFWNHVQAHPSFQSGGRTPFESSFTAGLNFKIPEHQHHLIRNPVLWSLPKNDTQGMKILRNLSDAGYGTVAIQGSASGEEFEDNNDFDDAEKLEQLAAEDEADCNGDDQVSVAGEFDNNNKTTQTLPEFDPDENHNESILPSIEQDDMFGVYPSDSDASEAEDTVHAASQDNTIEPMDEEDEYVGSDNSESESEQEIVLPGRRQVSAVKTVPTADPRMKVAHKGYGGKTVPVQVSAGDSDSDEESHKEEDNEIESSDEESDKNSDPDATPARALVPYPAPQSLLDASRHKTPGKKWHLFEEDIVIGHMLDVRDEDEIVGEERFRETCRRLEEVNNIVRSWGAVKNFWNRTGRARSGFDERKNKKAPLATSQQGKHLKKNKKNSKAKPSNKFSTPTSSRQSTQSTTPSALKTIPNSASTKDQTTPNKKASKNFGLPSPSATPNSASKKSATASTSAEPTFSLQDVQKMQADFQANMRAEMQEMMKGLAQAAAKTVQPTQVKTSDAPTSSKKRSRDAGDDLEDDQGSHGPSPKRSRPSALPLEPPSRHRIPERREDRERRPRTAMQKMFSSRRDSPPAVDRRSEVDYHEDEPVRRPLGPHYHHRDDHRNYNRQQSDYYRRDNSARQHDDRRRSEYRY